MEMWDGRTLSTIADFEWEEQGYQPMNVGSLKTLKGKETDSSLEPPERNTALPTLWF